jgi:hypothetical protein
MPDDEHTRRARPAARRTAPHARRFLLAVGATLGVGLVVGVVIGLVAFGGGGTTTTTVLRTVPGAAGEPTQGGPTPPAARSDIRVAVLNGAGVSGIAGRTAARARRIGYTQVSAGDAPRQPGPSTVYFRPRAAAEAAQVARDLGITQARPLPGGSALAAAAPAAAQVIVVLGSG